MLSPQDAADVASEAARFAAEARSLVRTASEVTAEAVRALNAGDSADAELSVEELEELIARGPREETNLIVHTNSA